MFKNNRRNRRKTNDTFILPRNRAYKIYETLNGTSESLSSKPKISYESFIKKKLNLNGLRNELKEIKSQKFLSVLYGRKTVSPGRHF